MLTREALNSGIPLTEVLDGKGLRLMAIPGTPLAELVKATRSNSNFTIQENGSFTPDIGGIEYMANCRDEMIGGSSHDFTMDGITEVAIKAVREHIYFAKNIVAGAVQDLVEATNRTLSETTPSSLLGMEVVVWSPPAPMVHSLFTNMVRKFEEVPFESPSLSMKLPDLAVSEILELLQTGSGSFDATVAEWASSKGESFFINIWEKIFQIKQVELHDTKIVNFRDYTEDKLEGWDAALAIFLIARKLTDNPLKGTEMPLPAFNRLIVDYRNQAGARLCRALDDLNFAAKNKILIRSTTATVTVVNADVYREWIENGGDNEILFGNLLRAPLATTVATINEKADQLKAAWKQHAIMIATIENNKRFARTKDILDRHFQKQLADTENADITVANRMNILSTFREQLEMVRSDELDDLWSLCLRLVCRSRFPTTSAERILEGIERIHKQNPELDVREAAAASVIEYIAYWVSTQFKITGF